MDMFPYRGRIDTISTLLAHLMIVSWQCRRYCWIPFDHSANSWNQFASSVSRGHCYWYWCTDPNDHLSIRRLWRKLLWHLRVHSPLWSTRINSWCPDKYIWHSRGARVLLLSQASRGCSPNPYSHCELLRASQLAYFDWRGTRAWLDVCRYWCRCACMRAFCFVYDY